MWLARVITLVLVLRHSVEEFSMCMVILPIYFISYKPFSTIARMIAIFFFFFSRLIRTNDKRCDYQSSPRSFISFFTAQAWRNDRFSRAPSQAQFWLVLKTMEMSGSKTPSVSSELLVCSKACVIQPDVRYFRTSNQIFWVSLVSRALVKGNEDSG